MEHPSLDKPTAGAFRFNTDSNRLEIYAGGGWTNLEAGSTPELQTGGTRALNCLGSVDSSRTNTIDYINISTTGNSITFGESTERLRAGPFALSSRTRACMGGGQNPGYSDTITYATISQPGNAIDFGNLVSTGREFTGTSNQVRGIIWGQAAPSTNIIQYITIGTTGNAIDFGDVSLDGTATANGAGYGNRTRSLFVGGYGSVIMQYVEYASTGNSAAFGDLIDHPGQRVYGTCGCSNAVRGLMFGGIQMDSPATSTVIDTIGYTSISTLGNQQDFGDLDAARYLCTAAASSTRGLIMGGMNPSNTNTMQYVQIATTGDATDFGDLTSNRKGGDGCSNGHGGL